MFAAWGRIVYRWRWTTLLGSSVVLALSIWMLLSGQGGTLTNDNNASTEKLDSVRASNLVTREAGAAKTRGSSFQLIFKSPTMTVRDPTFEDGVASSLARLRVDSRVTGIVTPFDPGLASGAAEAMRSRDGHAALVLVNLRDGPEIARRYYPELRATVRSDHLWITATGVAAIQNAFDVTTKNDLQRAELFSLPVSLILLLLVFGAVIASLIPVGAGILAVMGGIAATLLLARFTDVSTYAINIVSLIGFGVAIDYSLFLVNRFREERGAGATVEDAMSRTLATTGRAVTFSGITVAVGLAGMLFFQGTFLASMGAAGTMVVAVAIFYGLTFLPALLAILGDNVDRLRLPFGRARPDHLGFWNAMATWVMRRPLAVLVPALAVLILAGLPFAQLRLANGWVETLPAHAEARQGYETLQHDFQGQDQNRFQIVVSYPNGDPLSSARTGAIYDLSRRMARVPGVLRVESVVDLPAQPGRNLGRADYQTLYAGYRDGLPPDVRKALERTTGQHIVVLSAVSDSPPASDRAREILKVVRADPGVGGDGKVLVTGNTAFDVDFIRYLLDIIPMAVAFVLGVTYLVLFLLTGSLVLPLKAVVTNLLSISASFGALVWIFQLGHLSAQLGFTPQSIDPSIPVILFSIVFGLSMDYEVLMVSRIQEEFRRTGDNRGAVALGLERSGRLITGAAAIMIAVFVGFALSEVVIIKAIGLGLALAVAIDATIVRALIVPAMMRLMGDLNWWAPPPLSWLHQRLGLSEVPSPVEAVLTTEARAPWPH